MKFVCETILRHWPIKVTNFRSHNTHHGFKQQGVHAHLHEFLLEEEPGQAYGEQKGQAYPEAQQGWYGSQG